MKTNVEDWRHIPSKENIADILTKGAPPSKIGPGSTWKTGPSWLSQTQSEWPVTRVDRNNNSELEEIENEVAKFYRKSSLALVAKQSVDASEDYDLLDELIDECSDLQQLVKKTALLLRWPGRACSRLKLSQGLPEPGIAFSNNVSRKEYTDAFKFLIHHDQQKRLNIKKGSQLMIRNARFQMETLNKELLVKVLAGRVKNFPIGFSSSSEIPVLPCSKFAALIVRYHHYRLHRDVDSTVASVRQEVWPIKVRKLAASIDSKCLDCKLKRRRFESQVMGDLPAFRTEMSPAFTTVAMDLFGPWEIKDDIIKRGPRKIRKIWGIVYTCMSTRAVYIDVSIDYSTESVLHTVRRLMAFRGDVRLINSDPGSQLVGASREMKSWREGWKEEELSRFGADKNLEWRFVSSNSQHQNGVVEAIVKMVKGATKSILRVLGALS